MTNTMKHTETRKCLKNNMKSKVFSKRNETQNDTQENNKCAKVSTF